MREQLALLPRYLTAHLQLSLAALALGLLISLPIALWVLRRPRLEGPILGIASVLQTIPGLALLALMVPALAYLSTFTAERLGFETSSIGFLPALIALTLYSILPILRNTVTGISNLDPALIEAARGVGMTPAQRTRLVEIPLALPVMVAGIRTATVWVVGTATLATPVGATSLGNYIFTGLQTRNFTAVAVGSAAAATLALTLDGLIRLLEVSLQRRSRRLAVISLTALAALAIYATGAALAPVLRGPTQRPIVIGAKSFTEQYILAEAIALRIEQATGRTTRSLPSLGSTVAFDALRTGHLDLYVDYSGTVWATIMKRQDLPDDRSGVTAAVAEYLLEEHDIHTLGSLGFENTYALGMRRSQAEELGIRTISQLARHAQNLSIGGDFEFFARTEWKALDERYGLPFREQRAMDSSLMYQAVASGGVDVISAYSTDGRIAALDLILLEDDLGVIPPYDAIIVAGSRLAETEPEVLAALDPLLGAIDEELMQALNWAVDEEGRLPRDVAAELLERLLERH